MENKESNPNNKNNSLISHSRVKKVLNSMAHLFQPFKEVLTNVLPSSSILVKILDFFGRSISKFILFLAHSIPFIIGFLKSKLFKIIIIGVLFLVVFNTIASRIINNSTYKAMLSKAISDATGYYTVIEGRVSVNVLLLSLAIHNAAFYSPLNKESELSLNLLSVNHLKIKFSYLSLFMGKLVAKKVSINRAEVRYKIADNQIDNTKFIDQVNHINNITNLRLIMPEENISKLKSNENVNFIDNLTSNSNLLNKGKDNFLNENKLPYDNLKKYINLKDVFASKQQEKEHVRVNIDDKNFIYRIMFSLSNKLRFSLASIKKLEFNNVNLKFIDSNSKTIGVIDNLNGNLGRSFNGDQRVIAEGRLFNKVMFFNFKSALNNKKEKKFALVVSYENDNFKTKDVIINGVSSNSKGIEGEVILSGLALKHGVSQIIPTTQFINTKESGLKGTFNYNNSILSLPDLELLVNNINNHASFLYNFGGEGIVEVNLNLALPNLNPILDEFVKYKNIKHNNHFSSFNDMLLEWQTNKNYDFTPKFFAFNITINNTTINNTPLSALNLEAFLDSSDNLYINKFSFQGNDTNINLIGKLQLINKSGLLIMSAHGSLNNLYDYNKCSDNLRSFLSALAGNKDYYSINTKVFLNEDRIVFNDFSGRLGDKIITETNATLVERNNTTDLIISTKLDSLNLLDLQKVYSFNKSEGRLYYNTNHNITGLPSNLTVHLYLYSNNLVYKDLNFKNFQLDSSIISSGILIHTFSLTDSADNGTISGSFNFNDKVSPAIIGNLDFNNVLVNAEQLKDIIFSNYKLAGKVIVSGSVNLYGDYYYNGINKIKGNLSLTKYERLKVNKVNKTQGFYLTLVNFPYEGRNYYQIGDLYANISIHNNLVNLSPCIIRYIDNNKEYRGSLDGSIDILKDEINLRGILKGENNNEEVSFTVKGDLLDAQVNKQP